MSCVAGSPVPFRPRPPSGAERRVFGSILCTAHTQHRGAGPPLGGLLPGDLAGHAARAGVRASNSGGLSLQVKAGAPNSGGDGETAGSPVRRSSWSPTPGKLWGRRFSPAPLFTPPCLHLLSFHKRKRQLSPLLKLIMLHGPEYKIYRASKRCVKKQPALRTRLTAKHKFMKEARAFGIQLTKAWLGSPSLCVCLSTHPSIHPSVLVTSLSIYLSIQFLA